jgi:hypothetical protein
VSYLLVSGAIGYALLLWQDTPGGSPGNAGPPTQIAPQFVQTTGNDSFQQPSGSVPDSADTSVNDLSSAPTTGPDLSNDTQVTGPGNITTYIPNGWTQVPSGNHIEATDPNDSGRFVRYGSDSAPSGDLLSSLASAEQTNTSIQNGYQRVRLQSVDYHGSSAAVDWEFEYVKAGVTRHVESRWWVENGVEYFVYVSGTADRWPDTEPIFGVMTATATP